MCIFVCMKIEILLADDQLLILEGVKAILETEPKIEIVGTARDGKTAIALAKQLRPDILLIDIEMPKMNGILATKYICKYLPDIKVIVLTSHKNQDYIAEALLAGASGYLWKGNLIKDLKQEIYALGRGYSGIKAKLLTQTAKKNSATNVIRYREKIIHLKKYRKNIYKPAVNQKKQQRLYKTCNRRSLDSGITKAVSGLTFEPIIPKENRATNSKNSSFSSVYISSRFNRRKYLKIIIWLLLAISSIMLSIVIF